MSNKTQSACLHSQHSCYTTAPQHSCYTTAPQHSCYTTAPQHSCYTIVSQRTHAIVNFRLPVINTFNEKEGGSQFLLSPWVPIVLNISLNPRLTHTAYLLNANFLQSNLQHLPVIDVLMLQTCGKLHFLQTNGICNGATYT